MINTYIALLEALSVMKSLYTDNRFMVDNLMTKNAYV